MKLLKICMLIAVATITLSAGIAGAESDVVTLKISHHLPGSSPFQQLVLLPWCEKIKNESNGRLKCQIYPSMQLGGTPAQLFDQARDGIADIIWTLPAYQAGRFTKSEVFELPFMVRDTVSGTNALWEYIQKNALDEYKGTKLLFTHFNDGKQLHFSKKPVKTLEDFKGLKIRASGRLGAKTLAALGAIPVQMPASAVPEAISKGVIDGASVSWEVTTTMKLQEICKFHTETSPNQAKHSSSIFVFAMNAAKYNSLPPELKKVIDRNSGQDASRLVAKAFDSFTEPARKIAKDRHNEFNVLSNEEYKRWVKATEHVSDSWVKEVDAKGGNGRALLNDAKSLLKKYKD